jgi:hypothetical protein
MFSETRYARNGDLRVAYRASREGPRNLVFVRNWFTNCEVVPELPSLQDHVAAGSPERVSSAEDAWRFALELEQHRQEGDVAGNQGRPVDG